MTVQLQCRNKIASNGRNSKICWTCGHLAKVIDGKCVCCNNQVRKHEDKELINIKNSFDDALTGSIEIEYRFYTKNYVYFVKASTLREYINTNTSDKFEKFHHFVKKVRDSGELSRIPRW